MGKAVAEAAVSAGIQLVPVTFSSKENPSRTLQVGSMDMHVHGPSEREYILSSVLDEFPNLVLVDYTVPDAVNGKILLLVFFLFFLHLFLCCIFTILCME